MSQAALASMHIASRRWYCSLWLDSERNYHTFRLHASEKNTTELFRVILWSSSSNVFFCSRINTRVSLNVIAFIAGRNPNLIESLRVLSESSQTRSLLNDEYGGVCCEHVVTDNVVEFIQLTFNGWLYYTKATSKKKQQGVWTVKKRKYEWCIKLPRYVLQNV